MSDPPEITLNPAPLPPLPATDRHVKAGTQSSEFFVTLAGALIAMAYVIGTFLSGNTVSMDDVQSLILVVTGPYTAARVVTKGAAILKGVN